ncbi:MAG: AIR synthase-related protein [Saprospiraceae bacterium]|nr:phosphoribosylformylglycinamidine cyclo-ligase [Lewinella sp.]
MDEKMKYDLRGVSATKDEVHAAIKGLDKGLYPKAFCKIIPDAVGGDPAYCNIMHADTAGTKTSLAYLYWKETGDLSVWKGIAQDALVMNLDDMACVGCYQDIVISSTIGRNKNLISGDVIATIIQAAEDLAAQLGEMGIRLHMAGGETADVGDIVRTIDVGYTAFARMRRADTIVNNIRPGDVIVGMASYGQATYEDAYNGGMGSNGLTSARHDVLAKAYAGKYPDSFDPNTPDAVIFTGSKKLTDKVEIPGYGGVDVGKLILSPTRTFLPVLRPLIEDHRDKIHGIIHCTGGGQTKVQKFIGNVRVIKDQLFDLPPLFKLIQEESGTGWKEMYQVFNMGNRMEVYLAPEHADLVLGQAREFGIDAQIVGRVERAEKPEVRIESPFGIFEY